MSDGIPYLNTVLAVGPRAPLTQLFDSFQACFLFVMPRNTTLVLFACLVFMPLALMHGAHLEATCYTCNIFPSSPHAWICPDGHAKHHLKSAVHRQPGRESNLFITNSPILLRAARARYRSYRPKSLVEMTLWIL